jgi:hypothetical protein
MLSRAAELVNGRVEPPKSAFEVLKSETEVLKNRASRFLRRTSKLSKQRAIVALKVCERKVITDWGNAIVNTTFGLLMGSLVVLLILIHSGVPIVGK